MNEYPVSFFWKGKISFVIFSPDLINDKTKAEGLIWGGIRKWFEDKNLPMPEFVRNVQYEGKKEYQWDVLPLQSSLESCK